VFLTLFATLAAICVWCLLVVAAVNEGWFKSALTTSRAPAALVEAAQESFRKALELQPGFSSDYSANDYGLAGS